MTSEPQLWQGTKRKHLWSLQPLLAVKTQTGINSVSNGHTQIRVWSLPCGACKGSISGGTVCVGGLARGTPGWTWFGSGVSGKDDGGGESQWTDENSESPIERNKTQLRAVMLRLSRRRTTVDTSRSRSKYLVYYRCNIKATLILGEYPTVQFTYFSLDLS